MDARCAAESPAAHLQRSAIFAIVERAIAGAVESSETPAAVIAAWLEQLAVRGPLLIRREGRIERTQGRDETVHAVALLRKNFLPALQAIEDAWTITPRVIPATELFACAVVWCSAIDVTVPIKARTADGPTLGGFPDHIGEVVPQA